MLLILSLVSLRPSYAGISGHHVCTSRRLDDATVFVYPRHRFASAKQWLQRMGRDRDYAVAFMRCLEPVLRVHDLWKVGFRMRPGQDEGGRFTLIMHEPAVKVLRQAVSPAMPYDPGNLFQYRLKRIDPDRIYQRGHSMAILGLYGNYDVYPRNSFVSIVDFVRKASNSEVADFWRMVKETAERLTEHTDHINFETRAGSASGQEDPHFSVRVFAPR